MKSRVCLFVVVLFMAAACLANTVALQLVPSETTVNTGDIVTLQAIITGLGDPGSMEVGSFDIFEGFDPSLLLYQQTVFTSLLGDPSLGQAIIATGGGADYVEAVDVSLLSIPDLDAMQPSDFTLATFYFVATGSGSIKFRDLGGPIDNGLGQLIAGTKTKLPEPSSLTLLLAGIAAGSRRFARRSPKN